MKKELKNPYSRSPAPKDIGPWRITRLVDNKAYETDILEYLKQVDFTPQQSYIRTSTSRGSTCYDRGGGK